MERHEFLAALHAGLRPRNYLEIGVDTGLSLELSRVPSIGIDPKFQVRTEIRTDVALVRATQRPVLRSTGPAQVRPGHPQSVA